MQQGALNAELMHLSISGPTTPPPLWDRDGELWVDFSPFRPQNLPQGGVFVFGHLVEAY